MKCNLWFILMLLILSVCGNSFSQEWHEETNAQEVFSYPYPIGGETVPTEVEVVPSRSENMEVIPESFEKVQSAKETKKTVSPQVVEVFTEKVEKNVIPQSVGVFSDNEMRAVAAPVAQPVEIMEGRHISPPQKASERIKGMQKLDNIRSVSVNEHKR